MGFYVSRLGAGIDDETSKTSVWEQTKVRIVISYFNWIEQRSYLRITAAQRAGLADRPWAWNDIATCPTLL